MSRTTYCRARGVRAFTDKQHGWTLVTRNGEFVCLRNAASLRLWDALAEPSDEGALVERLQSCFPAVPPDRLQRDVQAFLRELEALGLVMTGPLGPPAD
jgi:hypothetical protein